MEVEEFEIVLLLAYALLGAILLVGDCLSLGWYRFFDIQHEDSGHDEPLLSGEGTMELGDEESGFPSSVLVWPGEKDESVIGSDSSSIHPSSGSLLFIVPVQQVFALLLTMCHTVLAVLNLSTIYEHSIKGLEGPLLFNGATIETEYRFWVVIILVACHTMLAVTWIGVTFLLGKVKEEMKNFPEHRNISEYYISHKHVQMLVAWCTASVVVYLAQCASILLWGYSVLVPGTAHKSDSDTFKFAIVVIYVLNVVFIVIISLGEVFKRRDLAASSDSQYESLHQVESQSIQNTENNRAAVRKREKNWLLLLGVAFKYVWPQSLLLQARASVCIFLIAIIRLLNLAVPYTYKKVIDEFSKLTNMTHPEGGGKPHTVPFSEAFYPWVACWMALFFLQGGSGGGVTGLLPNIRSYLWIPISQGAYKRMSVDIFSHVLSLDHSFHLHRKTGELLRIMDRGTASIQTLLGTVVFQIGPAIFDVVAAAIFLALRMEAWIAIIVFCTVGMYIPMTIIITEWRGKFRRDLNRLDNARSGRATDALLNYETVKIFGNEGLEKSQYRNAIDEYQAVDYKLSSSMNVLNILQSFVIFAGMFSGILICTKGIADGTLTVGDAVLFVTLMQQLYAPLNFFGSYYRMIQNALLDMEGVFQLLDTEPDVQDSPMSKPFLGHDYAVAFNNVRFSYNNQAEVLKGVSFSVPAGRTVALVGATGSGKSSILRLLLRFYDPTAGSISLGGQELSSITLESLRSIISVVPQDTVLFNDTIEYNIRYGNPEASEEDIIAAAKGACIHDTVMKFPKEYNTMVGERGLRLSGGEKQRVAFARAILKNPPILVLDEATSSLDSITEHQIQETLSMKRQDRTVIIVAHRLSTIIDADSIIVVGNGEILEIGNHRQLLEKEGFYANLWKKQSTDSMVSEPGVQKFDPVAAPSEP